MLKGIMLSFVGVILFSSAGLLIAEEQSSWRDVDYVGDGIVGHRLDIYLPEAGSGPYPVVVYIYGSAFMNNDGKSSVREDFLPVLGRAGFAVAAINHRGTKTDKVIFPALIHDVKAAIRFIRANAATYNLDPSRIGATGCSSGGHLVAMLGTSGGVKKHTLGDVTMDIEGSLGVHTGVSSCVQAVCDWFGPTDFMVMDSCGSEMNHDAPDSPESILIGGPIQENPDKCRLANPITYVSSDDPPFMIFHGDKDPLVPYCNSEALDAALDKAGVPSDFTLVEGAGHGDGLIEPKYLNKMVQFFKKNLRPELAAGNIRNTNSFHIHKEGDIPWQHTVGENIEATTTIDDEGNIYTTGSGYVWSFSPDGKLRWETCPLDKGCKGLQQEYPYALGVASSPAVSPDGKRVYITGYAGVFAFRTSDGTVLWKKTVFDNYYEFAEKGFEEQVKMWKEIASKDYPKIFATTPAISADGTRLYAGAGDNDFSSDSFYCIDTRDGSVVWEYVMPHPPQQVEEGRYTRGYLGGASLGPDGTVYVASQHGWLISLTDNGDSFTENWVYNVGAEMRMPPAMDAKGYLYVGSSSAGGYIHKVDSRTGKKAEGKWPVKTLAGEVFAAIAIASDGTVYANSEDHRLWAFNPDGTVKWNNLEFEHWGGDPLVRADDRIIVTSQLKGAAHVVCIRDDGDKGVIEWFSEPITKELAFNETNVNIGPNGDIYVTSGVESPHALFAIKGNSQGLSKTSPWPKYMGNIQNNGNTANQLGSVIQELPSDKDHAYNEFYRRVQEEEPYIGFFAAEKKCITRLDDAYRKARREFFLGVSVSDEEVGDYRERFVKFCRENDYLNDGCEKEWEKTLVILSYELYANIPIFEFSADNVIEHRNLVFAEYPNKKLELDLFLPEEPLDKPMPCVVCIHGGGWRVNRRIWFEPFAKYLASKGIAAVTIDYRMLPAVEIIDCVYDCKVAVRWVRANAEKYGIDPDRIGALGASAGAHLTALLATTANVPELEGSGGNQGVSSAIQAGVGFATPAFKMGSESSREARKFGLTTEDMKLISPYENISSDSAPLYLVQGTADETVDTQNSQDLYDRYKEVGAYVKLKWIPDKGHDFYEGTDLGIELATKFFKKQFGLEKDIENSSVSSNSAGK